MSESGMTALSMINPAAERSMAFGSAVLSASPALKCSTLRLTMENAAAENLEQVTLTRTRGAQARFEAGPNIMGVLFRIAHSAFLPGIRRTRRLVAWDPDRRQPMPIQLATQNDALYSHDLNVALAHLPWIHRIAAPLIARDGMSITDAAGELGVPIGTMRSRVCRARTSVLAYVMGESTMDNGSHLRHPTQSGQMPPAQLGREKFCPPVAPPRTATNNGIKPTATSCRYRT